ncbi:MAG: translation elongation factor Ts [Candidatus Omnitrophota bacterium]
MVTKDKIMELREKTGAGIMDCKGALTEAKGDIEKAVAILRQRGALVAQKKAGRVAGEGRIESYIHHSGKIGSILEINCETDFVARTEDFKKLAKDIAMQVVATNPHYLSKEEIPKTMIEKEKLTAAELDKLYKTVCLLEQPFIRDEKITIKDYIDSIVGKVGEKIVVKRFLRYQLGE